jgi:predicted Zn-dependent protease
MIRLLLIPLLSLPLLHCGCHRVVGTGRSQVNMLSESQEAALGRETFEAATANATIVRTGPDAEMVRRVGMRIVRAAGTLYPSNPADHYDWTFVLLKDDSVNAWAAPGGKVAVYSGLLPVTKDEDGLAVVLGHEVAHVLARHSGEQVSQALIMNGALTIGSSALGDMDPASRELVMQAMGAGSHYGVALPFSRLHEAEADEIGLFLTAEACYDPRAAIGVWKRMSALSPSRPPEFLSTHPDPDNRIEELSELMPGAMAIYQRCGASDSRSGRSGGRN